MDRPWRLVTMTIVVVIVVLFIADWRGFQQATRQIEQTRELVQDSDRLLSSITNAETGERGYLLTGDKKYLAPYQAAVKAVPQELDDLAKAAAAARREVSLAAHIRTLTNDKLAELKSVIDTRDREGDEAALTIMRTGAGELTMDEVRTACKLLVSSEEVSLFERTRTSELDANRSRIIVLAGCLVLAVLLFRLGSAVDTVIADREKFAANVEESRRLLQTTLESIGDAVIVTDAHAAVRFINPIAQKLTGWSAKAASKKTLKEVFQIADKGADETQGGIVRQSGATIALPHGTALISRQGHEIPIEDSASPIRDASGNTFGTVIVFRDVTLRRAAERELERWKNIFAGAGFGMFLMDQASMTITDINPAFASMHGYSPDELRGEPLVSLTAPEFRKGLSAALAIAREKGRHLFETQHKRRDGSEFPALIDLTGFGEGRDKYWAGYCSDITVRKQFEDTLRESEERFRTLANALPQLVWSTDPEGKVEYVNPAWTTYAGWPSTGSLPEGDPWEKVLYPEDRPMYLQTWKESLKSGNVFEAQVRLRRGVDGSYRWFLCKGVAVRDRSGKVLRWLGSCTDVQHQIESANQLKQANDALRRSNSDLEQFAYAASHDLQEPLRMVSIYSQLLKEEYESALDDQAKAYIDFAVNGAQRMSNLLTDLLAYSRASSAPAEAPEASDARTAVQMALLNLSATIDSAQAEIHVGSLPAVRIPEIHLVQLFQNLIGNALKYRKSEYPEGEHPAVWIDAVPDGNHQWVFSVKDNGIGIETEYLTQIFGVFKRLHGHEVAGTGIGLALCQKIVERAGGRIWVESRSGEGSTFLFTLPEANSQE